MSRIPDPISNFPTSSFVPIDDTERAKRWAIIAYAKATNIAEGMAVNPAAEAIYARYIAGEIDLAAASRLLRN